MARDYITLGPTPMGEDCIQVGSEEYHNGDDKREVKRFCEMLQKRFPEWSSEMVMFGKKTFPHDFGSYTEACVYYDDEKEESCEFAYFVEGNLPEMWDDETILHLKKWPPQMN